MPRIRIRACVMAVTMMAILGILLGARPAFAQKDAKGRSRADETAAKQQQAATRFRSSNLDTLAS